VRQQITHDMIIDFMFANPRATQREIAVAFGFRSQQTISVIVNSDSFQAALSRRQEKLIDPLITATVEDRIKLLAAKSAENLAEALEREPMNTKLNLEVFREAARAGNYGAKAQVAVQTSFVVALPGPAASTQEWRDRFAPGAVTLKPRLDEAPVEARATPVVEATDEHPKAS